MPTFRGSEIFISCSGEAKISSVKTILMKLGPWTRFIFYFSEKKICEILICFFRTFLLTKLLGAPIWHIGKFAKKKSNGLDPITQQLQIQSWWVQKYFTLFLMVCTPSSRRHLYASHLIQNDTSLMPSPPIDTFRLRHKSPVPGF